MLHVCLNPILTSYPTEFTWSIPTISGRLWLSVTAAAKGPSQDRMEQKRNGHLHDFTDHLSEKENAVGSKESPRELHSGSENENQRDIIQ